MLAALFEGFAQIQAEAISDGVLPKNKRQVAGTGVTTSTPTPSPTSTMSSSDETTPSVTPTSTQITSSPADTSTSPLTTSQSVESTSVVPTTARITTTDSSGSTVTSDVVTSATITRSSSRSSSSAIVDLGSTTINRSTLSSDITITSALVASQTVATTFESVFTSDGQLFTTGISTNRVVATTTGFATSTISPSLQDSNSSGSSLSDSSKKIIGGVVGGVGGAILLGGIALVAWRLWGKKKRQRLPQDDFVGSGNDSVVKEARDSDLDRYHQQPVGGPVNTASNF